MTARPTAGTVAHVTSAHFWTDNRIHLREAASLAEQGYTVHLVAVDHDVELRDTGVEVHRIPRRSRLRRMTWSTVHAGLTAMRLRPEIVHLHDPELAWLIPAMKARGIRVVFDAHEDLPEQIRLKHYLKPWAKTILLLASRGYLRLVASSDAVVAATDAIAARFPASKVTVVRNFPILRAADSALTSVQDRPPYVTFIGAMTEARGALAMLDAIAHPAFPEGWRAIFAGTVTPAELVMRMQTHPAWPQCEHVGVLSPDAARDLLGRCRVGLTLSADTPSYRVSLPTKMFEYFAAGMPVVVSDFPLWRAIVEQYDCGLLVDPADPGAVARAVRRYADDSALLVRHSRNALAAAHDLNWPAERGRLFEVYRKLAR